MVGGKQWFGSPFGSNAGPYPDPAFYLNADPDPESRVRVPPLLHVGTKAFLKG
jgi:hypothetical protein